MNVLTVDKVRLAQQGDCEAFIRLVTGMELNKEDLFVWVEAKTNEVESAQWGKEEQTFGSAEEKEKKFKKPMYTDEEAITTMNPLMKKIFGVDLTGYQVEVDKDWYKFSKKGSPTVSGVINEKGKVFLVFQSTETK